MHIAHHKNPYFAGVVGITLSHTNPIPKDFTNLADLEAAETYNQFSLGWWASPIFGTGDYPDVMKWQIGNKSLEQGFNSSRLPVFTEEEIQMNKGTVVKISVMMTKSKSS